jgi:hypothetical protein
MLLKRSLLPGHPLSSPRRLKGVEALLQRLSEALPGCPYLALLAQALAELCKEPECKVRPCRGRRA